MLVYVSVCRSIIARPSAHLCGNRSVPCLYNFMTFMYFPPFSPTCFIPHPPASFLTHLLHSHPPASFPTHLLHSPPTCVIPHPPASFPTHLRHSPPTCVIPHPPASFPTHLRHSPPTCVIPHPPASYSPTCVILTHLRHSHPPASFSPTCVILTHLRHSYPPASSHFSIYMVLIININQVQFVTLSILEPVGLSIVSISRTLTTYDTWTSPPPQHYKLGGRSGALV